MILRAANPARFARGHTLIELMVAIIIGMLLVLAAFQVMASFEGNKRTSTAMNDALQSGSYGLYEIDKMVRSAGTGISRYGSIAGFGCLLNYTPAGPGAATVASGVPAALPAPFTTTVGGATGVKVRLAPAVIFPGASTVKAGTGTTGSDALMLMLGGAGYGEVPIPITEATGPTVDSTVGFSANQWVLVGPSAISQCLITEVAAGYTFSATNVVLPLTPATVGGASVAANDYAVGLGLGQAANFIMYGVNPTDDSLYSFDLLNDGVLSQKVSDDVVLIRAVYGVDPTNSGTLTWTNPVSGAVVSAVTYDFSPAGLLDGSATANTAIKSIRAIRVALVVRAPLLEKSGANLNAGSLTLFQSLAGATQANTISTSWTVPADQNYRYRELETTIPIRNGFF